MKFYNPFKPHIVSFGEYYAIRKLCWYGLFVFQWEYLDTYDNWGYDKWWWTYPSLHFEEYCKINTVAQAKELLDKNKPLVIPKSTYIES
jgi:hypothetical protein